METNLIWRFYVDSEQLWRWQQLRFNTEVAAESAQGFKEYQDCVDNAQARGYCYQPSRTSQEKPRVPARRRF
jgi:hypothetical protein